MGNTQTIKKVNYEDIQNAIKNSQNYLIINTLPIEEQKCLIVNTVIASEEELLINNCLKENKMKCIIIYGKNCNDESVNQRWQQLINLGFYNVCVYFGGMFEWLMLQDIYGKDLFPTTQKELDLLKYRSKSVLNIELLEY